MQIADSEFKALRDATEQFHGRSDEAIKEIKTRVLDLEQKGVRNPRGGDGGGDNSIMPIFEQSDGFKSLLKGETKSARIQIPANFLQRKAIITSTISGGTIGPADRVPVITAPSQRKLMVRDLLPSVPTSAGSTEFVREVSFTNNAGPQGGVTSPTVAGGQGEIKPASEMVLELVNSPVITIAHTLTVSRQALDDSAALAQHLETRGIYGWQLDLDEELLTGTGAAGTLNGLVNNASAFTGGATNQTPLDTIRKAITQLSVADNVASGVVLHPRDAETLEIAKDGEARYMAMVVYVDGQPYVWRIPIVESNTMTQGQFLVGDFAMAATVRDRQEAHVEISLDHLGYRAQNLALILIEGRVGLEIHRPTALVTGSLANSG